jgi:hypothetical protein
MGNSRKSTDCGSVASTDCSSATSASSGGSGHIKGKSGKVVHFN